MTRLDDLIAAGDDAVDLTAPAAQPMVRDMAGELLGIFAADGGDALTGLAEIGRSPEVPINVRVASRLATSKLRMASVSACDVGIQFAMWGEHRRLRPRDDDNPLGEDALRVKLDQLDWLLADTPVRWHLQAVDDGCPDDSAGVAREMAEEHPLGSRVSFPRLAGALPATTGPLAGLADVDDSHKGGAMLLGAKRLVDGGVDAVILTDADVSVDLGQIGLLLAPWQDGAGVVIGDRKHPYSVLRKAEARWGPGIVVLRHIQRMVGRALFSRGIADTQAAFKLYGAPALADVLAAPSTFGFSFDSDWLYAAINGGHAIATTPFAFVDSFAESASITQGPMSTWESLLVGLTASARDRGADHHAGMAKVVDRYGNEAVLSEVVQQVPAALADVDPARLGDPDLMSPEALADWIAGLVR